MAKAKDDILVTLKALTKQLNSAVAGSRIAVKLAGIAKQFPETVTPQAMSKAVKDIRAMINDAQSTAGDL